MGTRIRKVIKMVLCMTGLAALLVLSCIVGTRIERRDQQARELMKEHVSTIAVVNMDDGVLVRDEHVNYASQLMSFPSGNFTVTGLTDAKSGIDNGTYAAYIVIPETFSASVTSIETDPQKVTLNCQYNPRLDEEARMQAMTDVNAFIAVLNSNTAYMYLDAIMEEFHRVQDDSSTILANDDTELQRLSSVDADQLIAEAEPVGEIVVDNDIQPVELGAYTTQNDALMDSMQAGYVQAVQRGRDDLAAIQDDRSGVEQASDTFFSTYESVLQDTASDRESLLSAGREKLDDAVGAYDQDVEAQEEGVKEAIVSMIDMQLENDQKAADDQLVDIVVEMNDKADAALSAQRQQWQEAYKALKEDADERLLADIAICQENLSGVVREIYMQGYNKALGDIAEQVDDMAGSGSGAITADKLKDTLEKNILKDVQDIPEEDVEEYIKDYDTTVGDHLGDVTVKWDELEAEHPGLPGDGGDGEDPDTGEDGEDPGEGGENPGEGEGSGEGGENPGEGEGSGEAGENPGEGEGPGESGEDPGEGEGPGEGGDPGAEGEDSTEEDQGAAGGADDKKESTGSSGNDGPADEIPGEDIEESAGGKADAGAVEEEKEDAGENIEESTGGKADAGAVEEEREGAGEDIEESAGGKADAGTVEEGKEDAGKDSTGEDDGGTFAEDSVGGLCLYGAAGGADGDLLPANVSMSDLFGDQDYKITLSTVGDDAAVDSTVTATLDLFKLEPQAEEISNVIQTCFVDALSESGEQQMDRLSEAGAQLQQIMGDYEGRLRGYDPMGYIDDADLTAYLYDIEVNAGEMLGTVEKNNADHMMYADEMYSNTTEHTMQMKDSLDKAGTQTAANVESCIAGLIDSRKDMNSINTELLRSFAGCLTYTRVESQGNAEVYDHIVNPVENLVSGQSTAQTETAPPKERSMKVWIVTILAIGIVLFLAEVLAGFWRQYRKTGEGVQEEGS